jgi:hypothetical protein
LYTRLDCINHETADAQPLHTFLTPFSGTT